MRPLCFALLLALTSAPAASFADVYSTLEGHKSARKRAGAAKRLGKREGSAKAVDALMNALGDESWRVRSAAVSALGRLRAHRALFAVCGLQGDKSKNVRKALKKAARRLGGREGCAPFQIKIELKGDNPKANALVKQQIGAGIAKNALLVVTDTPTKKRDKRAKVLKLKVELEQGPNRIRCAIHQSIFHTDKESLSGMAVQRAEIEFDKIYNDDFLRQNIEACLNAAAATTIETFEDYLVRALR